MGSAELALWSGLERVVYFDFYFFRHGFLQSFEQGAAGDYYSTFYFEFDFQFSFHSDPIRPEKQLSGSGRYNFGFADFKGGDGRYLSIYSLGDADKYSVSCLGWFCHSFAVYSDLFKQKTIDGTKEYFLQFISKYRRLL
jgi:hypothetical protein